MKYETDNKKPHWFVMRDLKRANAKLPAYKQLEGYDLRVYTPKKQHVVTRQGKRVLEEVPIMSDLLFVYESREKLDPVVEAIPLLQYRWLRNTHREPMTVPEADMERFIHAVSTTAAPKYYTPGEVTPAMYGRKIRIVGGYLDGYEGSLITTRGSKVKRLLVELPGILAVGVEINPEYIQFIP